MNKQYVVKKGDTLEKIAIQFYGDPSQSSLIKSANALIDTDLITGITLLIPTIPEIESLSLDSKLNIKDAQENEASFIIDNVKFTNFEDVFIKKTLGTASDYFMFKSVWDEKEELNKSSFVPFSYKDILVYIENNLVIAGKLDKISFSTASDVNRTVLVEGRTKTGILADITIDEFPQEINNQNLEQIAKILLKPFGLSVIFNDDPGPIFQRVTPDIGETVFEFLKRLAIRRGLLISSTEKGELLFWKADISSPSTASLIEGEYPFISGENICDGTLRYSSYRTFGQSQGINDIRSIVKDSAIKNVFRPQNIILTDVTKGDVQNAALWERSRSIGNSIIIELIVSSWKNIDGIVWNKNQKITLKSDSLVIYKETDFIIKEVDFFIDTKLGKLSKLSLVLPEVYTFNEPEKYPWD